MATYKLMQDIEAEDHILGPLSLRQFIFALVAAFLYYISFLLYTKHVAFLLILFLPPALFFTFFAIPFGRDQPTEIWALAKLRFLFKPRRRVWDQSGIKELVTVTAPKKIERVFTNGLSQTEVRSRLSALANTIDSRGWAVKNVNVNAYTAPDPWALQQTDRLIDVNSMPQEVPNYDVQASDDILDETSNPIAQQFDQMIDQSAKVHRQQIVNQLNSGTPPAQADAPPADYWFMGQAGSATPSAQFVTPGSQATAAADETPDEAALAAELKARNNAPEVSYSHLRTLQPLGSQPPVAPPPADPAPQAMTAPPDPAILALANNDDLNVATLAREAQKAKSNDQPDASSDEVVISLR